MYQALAFLSGWPLCQGVRKPALNNRGCPSEGSLSNIWQRDRQFGLRFLMSPQVIHGALHLITRASTHHHQLLFLSSTTSFSSSLVEFCREQSLRGAGFQDTFADVKKQENLKALELLPAVLRYAWTSIKVLNPFFVSCPSGSFLEWKLSWWRFWNCLLTRDLDGVASEGRTEQLRAKEADGVESSQEQHSGEEVWAKLLRGVFAGQSYAQ